MHPVERTSHITSLQHIQMCTNVFPNDEADYRPQQCTFCVLSSTSSCEIMDNSSIFPSILTSTSQISSLRFSLNLGGKKNKINISVKVYN